MSSNAALVTFLLDRSGSMGAVKGATIEAFNAYIEGLKDPSQGKEEILFNFLQFDTISLDRVYHNEPIANVQPLNDSTYQPRGGTPLIDAAYKTIKAVEAAVGADKSRKVVICFQTDGEENSSIEHTLGQLQALIKEKQELGWQFNFLGAGVNAYVQAAVYGIAGAQTMSYNRHSAHQTRQAFASSARNTRSYLSGQSMDTSYSLADRLAAGDAFVPADLAQRTAAQAGGPLGQTAAMHSTVAQGITLPTPGKKPPAPSARPRTVSNGIEL